jgi:hypothetical protein
MADKFLTRVVESVGSYGNYKVAPERVDAETIVLPRVALINGELESFTRFIYHVESGRHVNLSGNTCIPSGVWCPWGSKGNLTRTERDVMRKYMLSFAGERPTPLYFYMAKHRRWYVNTPIFDTLALALAWVGRHQMSAKDYLRYGGLVWRVGAE